MNLTRFSILFALIAVPFMLIGYTDTLSFQKRSQIQQQYIRIIQNAVDDGAAVIRRTSATAGTDGYEMTMDAHEVVDAFLTSYCYGFNAKSNSDRIRVLQYVVAVLVTTYDGFYIYSIGEVTDEEGNQVMTPIISEKLPYAYNGSSHLIHVTLGDHMSVLDKVSMLEDKGDMADLDILPPIVDTGDYGLWRSKVITDSITTALDKAVTLHNRYGSAMGLAYEFHIPLGDNSALAQSVSGPGIMAFVQGQPLGGGHHLDLMAFSQGSSSVTEPVTGYLDGYGDRYYCFDSCRHETSDPVLKRFTSPREAAANGYYPCHMLNK